MAAKDQDEQQKFVLQKVILAGQSFDLSLLTECVFIETFDLSGPKLVLRFHDRISYIRNELGIKEEDEIEVILADPFHEDGIDETMKFTILTMPIKEGILTINAMQSDVRKSKIQVQAERGRSYIDKPFEDVVGDLMPNATLNTDKQKYTYSFDEPFKDKYWTERKETKQGPEKLTFPAKGNFYLTPTDNTYNTPAKLLKRIALEYGHNLFWKRGKLWFIKTEDLTAEQRFYYDYDDHTCPNQVHDYRNLNVAETIRKKTEYNYRGFDITKGRIKSGFETDPNGDLLPIRLSGITDENVWENMVKLPTPMIDIVMPGNGFLQPGKLIYLSWNIPNKDAPIDESLPDRVIIGNVTHHYTPQRYFCRVRGMKWPEGAE